MIWNQTERIWVPRIDLLRWRVSNFPVRVPESRIRWKLPLRGILTERRSSWIIWRSPESLAVLDLYQPGNSVSLTAIQEFLAAITLFLNFLAKSNGETCQSATNVALCGKWYLCWSAGGAHVCFWSNRGQFHISSVLSLPIFCPLHFSSPSPSSPSALFSFHVLRLPLAAVSPASLQFIRLYYQLFFPLFQPESIDCLLVPSANVGVPRWLPSRPFVILLGLTGLWPDMGYKSNQMFRGEDTEECVIHSVPTKVPQLFYRLILIRIVLLDFSVSKIKNNQSLLVKMGSLNHCFGNWSVIVRWSDSAAENKQHITMYNLKYLGHDLGAIVEKIWAWTQQPPRIPSQLRWFSASYLFVFSRWRVSFLFFAPLHIWRSFILPAFLCRCISLEKQDVNSAHRRQKYASSSSQISFIFRQKSVHTNGSSSIPLSPPRCLGRLRHWNASDRMILRTPHSCWQTRYCRCSKCGFNRSFHRGPFQLRPSKDVLREEVESEREKRKRKIFTQSDFVWGRWKGKGHFGVISLRLQASFGRRGGARLACSSKSGSALTLRTWLATGGGCPLWDGVHSALKQCCHSGR